MINCISIDFAEYNVDEDKVDLFDVNEGESYSYLSSLKNTIIMFTWLD